MNITYLMLLIGLAIASFLVVAFNGQAKVRKTATWVGVFLAAGALIIGMVAPSAGLSLAGGKISALAIAGAVTPSPAGEGTPGVSSAQQCPYSPPASWSGKDAFGSTALTGTSYYKVGNNPYTTTAITSINKDERYQYWVDNSTYYVDPLNFLGVCGSNDLSAKAYKNGSISITAWDILANAVLTDGGGVNASLAANGNAKIRFTIIGSAKTANMPFGGLLVVETNNTLSSITCTGDGISSNSGKFKLTHSNKYTTNTNVIYEVASGYDVSTNGGMTGVEKEIKCEFTNGATAPMGELLLYFIPADYYLGNDGNFYLDTEKAKNADTTRTGKGGTNTYSYYWGA